MMETKKFQWKIPNFTKLNVSQLYSDTFKVGGCRWKVRTNPKRYRLPDYFPLFLLCCSDPEVKLESGGQRPRTIQAEYRLTLVDQINGRSFTKRGGKQDFKIGGGGRGFESFIPYKNLFNPIEGFIVNDTIVIEAQVSIILQQEQSYAVNAADPPAVEIDLTSDPIDSQPDRSSSQVAASPVNVTTTNEFGKSQGRKMGIRSRMKPIEAEWKILGFAKYETAKSDKFLASGCEWNIVSKLKRYDGIDYLSLFLRCCSDMGGIDSWRHRKMYAEYSFTLVDQINNVNSITQGGGRDFKVGGKGWGYKEFIPLGELFDPDKGLVVNNTVLLETTVSTEERTLSDSDSDYDHHPNQTFIRRSTKDWQDSLKRKRSAAQEERRLFDSDSDSDHQPNRTSIRRSMKDRHDSSKNKRSAAQEEPERTESTNPLKNQQQDPIIIISSDSDSNGPDDIEHETDHQPNGPSLRQVKVEQVSELRNAADPEVPERVQTALSSNPKAEYYPDYSGFTSSKLIEELSMVTINAKSHPINRPALSLDQHRMKMARYLNMPLELLHKSDSLDNVERIALHITNHDPNVKVDKENLKTLLSDIKQGVSGSICMIETSSAIETSAAQMMEELEGRLNYRQKQMRWLEVEVSRLGKEEKNLEAEIQQLIARKGRLGDRMKSTADELGKVGQEASRELEEVKEQSKKRKRAAEAKLAAEENLAQLNRAWKGLKQKLGLDCN